MPSLTAVKRAPGGSSPADFDGAGGAEDGADEHAEHEAQRTEVDPLAGDQVDARDEVGDLFFPSCPGGGNRLLLGEPGGQLPADGGQLPVRLAAHVGRESATEIVERGHATGEDAPGIAADCRC